MFRAHFPWPMAALVGLIALAGCDRETTTNPVRGTVTLDGRPLARATVQFLARDPGGRDALGTTDADGVFHLSTFKPRDGAFAGKYKVVVRSVPQADPAVVATNVQEAMRAARRRQKPISPLVTIAPRYSHPGKTILEQEVPPSGEVVFALQSK
jgi:hypothetical protein